MGNEEIDNCVAVKKYSKDKWRLMYVLNHAHAEEEMRRACLDAKGCDCHCGRWLEERVAHIKRFTGIFPSDKNVEGLRTMLDKIRNMGKYEYEALYNSLPKEEK